MTSSLQHIRLERAREPGHPAGDPRSGYDIVAALDDEGRLDPAACAAAGEQCRVRRFEDDQTAAVGRLRRGPGGRWLLDMPGEADDAAGFRFDAERFVAGEYVSLIHPADGVQTFVVARVGPL